MVLKNNLLKLIAISTTAFICNFASALDECKMKPNFQPQVRCHTAVNESDCDSGSTIMQNETFSAYECNWVVIEQPFTQISYCNVVSTQKNSIAECPNVRIDHCTKYPYCMIISH